MLLVIESKCLDENLDKLRGLQKWMVEWGDPGAARTIEEVINSLNLNSVDVMRSVVIGSKQIIESV